MARIKKYPIIAAVAVIIVVVIVAAIYVTGTVSPIGKPVRNIKVGVVAPLTGAAAETGLDTERGAKLAIKKVNEEWGGVLVKEFGSKVKMEIIMADDESSRDGSVKAFTKLVTTDKVDIITGGFGSGPTFAGMVVAAEEGIPFVMSGMSSPLATRRTDVPTYSVFHYQPIAPVWGSWQLLPLVETVRPALIAKGLMSDRPLRVATVYQDSPFGSGFMDGWYELIGKERVPFERGTGAVEFGKLKGKVEIVYAEPFKLGTTDFRPFLSVIKGRNADVFVPTGFATETVAAIVQARRDFGIPAVLGPVCGCVEAPEYYTALPRDAGEYSLISGYWNVYAKLGGDWGRTAEGFRQRFTKDFAKAPGMMSLTTYDAILIIAKVVENAGSLDRAKIINALNRFDMKTTELGTVTPVVGGVVKFDPIAREIKTLAIAVQMVWDESAKELRTVVVWPNEFKTADFVVPPYVTPKG